MTMYTHVFGYTPLFRLRLSLPKEKVALLGAGGKHFVYISWHT
jgi:hypothetical protein